MALAAGRFHVRTGPPTLLTETASHVASAILEAKFRVEKSDGNSVIIEFDGIGLENDNGSMSKSASGDVRVPRFYYVNATVSFLLIHA